jgi:hypothetical protein
MHINQLKHTSWVKNHIKSPTIGDSFLSHIMYQFFFELYSRVTKTQTTSEKQVPKDSVFYNLTKSAL